MRQALAKAADGETVTNQVWRAAMRRWFHSDLKRRVAYLVCLTARASRYDIHGNVSGAVTEDEATQAAVELSESGSRNLSS